MSRMECLDLIGKYETVIATLSVAISALAGGIIYQFKSHQRRAEAHMSDLRRMGEHQDQILEQLLAQSATDHGAPDSGATGSDPAPNRSKRNGGK